MMIAYAASPSSSAPTDASRTQIITDANPREDEGSSDISDDIQGVGVLRLRGGPRNGQRVMWDEDVVDNEDCGRKSSKICCIYHKPRRFDESSSEESSDSDSDSEERSPSGGPRRSNHRHDSSEPHHRHHRHHSNDSCVNGTVNHIGKPYEPNAYEKAPTGKGKQKAGF